MSNVFQPAAPALEPVGARADGEASESIIDLHAIFAIVRRRLKLALALAMVVFVAALIVTVRAVPMYTANASVMIENRTEQVVNADAVLSGLSTDTATIDSEVEILKSRQLAGRVVESLRLDRDPEFNASLRKPGAIASIRSGIRNLFGASAPSQVTAEQAALRAQIAQDRVIDNVRRHLSIKRVGATYMAIVP
jgi:succinoglycan biosynthesis transport protein ExoP